MTLLRREFIALAGAVAIVPRGVIAQQATKVPRIVFLSTAVPDDTNWQAIVQGLADHGYIDGKSMVLERSIASSIDAAAEYAAEAISTRPDIILCITTPAALAAKGATTTIPIVISLNDPIAAGVISNLEHPGGNITGNSQTSPDLVGKQLGLLQELLPALRRLAVLTLPADPSHAPIVAQMRPAAEAAKIELVVAGFDETQDFSAQLEQVRQAGAQAFFRLNSLYFSNKDAATADFQIRTGIVGMTASPATQPFLFVIAYGPNSVTLRRQLGTYIDAILKGAKPGDLPVQQPTTYDLAINLKVAKAMGIAVPPSIYAQATIVVE